MRGAGCTFNDIVDRDIDAQVARTRGRPLPSGAVSVRAAWIFLALQCGVGLVILLQLNRIAILLGAASLILVAIYPFMKRVTWWPQAWLGLTFNWGALLGFAARTGHLAWPAFVLYAACFFWTLGYDTIYAHQDKDDDALIGVKSTALLLNANSRAWIGFFYLISACPVPRRRRSRAAQPGIRRSAPSGCGPFLLAGLKARHRQSGAVPDALSCQPRHGRNHRRGVSRCQLACVNAQPRYLSASALATSKEAVLQAA